MKINISDSELALLNALRKFDEVEMKTIDNIPQLKGATIDIPRRGKGDVVKAPIWLVKYLIDIRKLTISDSLIKLLSQNLWRELAQPISRTSIAKIDPRFYNIVYVYMYILGKTAMPGGKPLANKDDIMAAINKRREVISKLSELDLEILRDRLTFEEKVLLNRLRDINKDWGKVLGVD